MNDFEDVLTAALQEHAEGDVHGEVLFTGAQRLGQRYQRRRRVVGTGVGAALMVAAVVGVSVTVPSLLSNHHGTAAQAEAGGQPVASAPASGRGPVTTPSRPGVPSGPPFAPRSNTPVLPQLPRLPLAPSATPATTNPHVVGGDAGLLHFDVDPAATPASLIDVKWTSMAGLERLTMDIVKPGNAKSSGMAQLEVSRDRANLDATPTHNAKTVKVGAVSATVTHDSSGEYVQWEPLPGVWANLRSPGDEAAVVRFARGVSFDHVLRCVVPFKLGWVPAGTKLDACSIVFQPDGASGSATLALPGAKASYVTVEVDRPGLRIAGGTQKIGGHPAKSREYPGDGGHKIFQVDVDYGDHVVDLVAEGHYDRTTVTHIATDYQDDGGADPATWPPNPLG